MRRYFSLMIDNPNDVAVTTLRTALNKRPPPTARQYSNTLRMTNTAPIGANTSPAISVVTVNAQRALLIIQNNSVADTTTGDFAPTFYIGFGMTPVVGQDLALPPGVGIVFDVRTPIDAIYVSQGPFNNASSTVVIQGVVKEGSITNPQGDTANIAETGQLQQLVSRIDKLLTALGAMNPAIAQALNS